MIYFPVTIQLHLHSLRWNASQGYVLSHSYDEVEHSVLYWPWKDILTTKPTLLSSIVMDQFGIVCVPSLRNNNNLLIWIRMTW